ncbi:hypothetical protein PAXRUDRAFT_827786 [Paxillus rubicundulus Ve08.2h10]|uniref:Uncharacterized protein n=1 Tax=Paxillus rubicundulus Ve08.2h10 TaxID=930991 RepID=A0A0D0DX83_9AGAM|nr:hypothetical protein PAXRUDRAFT_827786 [Paxillus rubicundulus Ve08.2h10]
MECHSACTCTYLLSGDEGHSTILTPPDCTQTEPKTTRVFLRSRPSSTGIPGCHLQLICKVVE